ncbi:hypothetical protein Csa_017746 [Cucumis sativus]|uniref:Uncharacterized protein n=1 Tax=Cucumis sativus TaxID=3659 RepID=A0A0A0LTN6_CUCSA|nr:hypothetical protein Csa_017746 [Cucumis sativus]
MVREEGLSSESGEGVGEGDWRMEREKIDQRRDNATKEDRFFYKRTMDALKGIGKSGSQL